MDGSVDGRMGGLGGWLDDRKRHRKMWAKTSSAGSWGAHLPVQVCFALDSSVVELSEPQGDKAPSGPIEAALSTLWALAHPEEPEIL